MLHRTRDLLIRQRTMLSNALRAHLAEFGIIEKLGSSGLESLIALVEDSESEHIPAVARDALLMMVGQICDTHMRVSKIEKQIQTWHRASDVRRRLETIPLMPSSSSAPPSRGILPRVEQQRICGAGQRCAADPQPLLVAKVDA